LLYRQSIIHPQKIIIMKKSLILIFVMAASLTFLHCAKEGPRGRTGADGKDGNANVITYLFTDSAKIAWQGSYIDLFFDSVFTIPDTIQMTGMVLVYTKIDGQTLWYPVPGIGLDGTYTTRMFIQDFRLGIRGLDPDGSNYTGSGLPKFSAIKVVLVPSTTLIQIRKSGYIGDFEDHDKVMEMLEL
jgi:hypothetical protein